MSSAKEILTELESRRNKGQGLAHFQAYLDSVDQPQNDLQCIHIAGTNGKGSTLNQLRSILQEAGYRVGTFSSPYLETHFDRIRINDVPISEAAFLAYYERDHEGWFAYDLGSFEIDTAMAFTYFRDQKCDICIIEAGIGGRYDCTNVITPLVSIITNIGKDHMNQLGHTLKEIAWQKAGIIKDQIPLITSEHKQECLQVFEQSCKEHHSQMISTKQANDIDVHLNHIAFVYDGQPMELQGARYQIENAACAIEAAQVLKKTYGFHITFEMIQQGLRNAFWKGRFEVVWHDPLVIVDGAHNEEGIQALVESVKAFGKVRVIFSALQDKDTHEMMRLLQTISNDICVSEFPFYRVKPAKELAEDFPVTIDEDYRHAIDKALKNKDVPLLITGSLYFITEVRNYFKRLMI